LAVLGPNGAGKTTLLRILATLARPSSGRVFVGGLSLTDQAAAIRQHVGFVAHQTYLYDDLTVRENVEFYAKLYGVLRPRQRVDQILDLVGLRRRADTRVRALSRGLQQRAALARAIVHDPTILLLDEPDTGLDVDGVELVGRVMADGAGRRRTVILTTHNLERAVELTDRSVVLADGKVVYDRPTSASSVSALVAAIRGERGAA
jgi:heme exporter protein A